MTSPYYEADGITLYLGDCREITEWLAADVLVTDPPYGIGWSKGKWNKQFNSAKNLGIKNDLTTAVRDAALTMWGQRPALVFGSLKAEYPVAWKRMLVFEKPTIACGLFGVRVPWLSNWEPIFMLGDWPDQTPTLSAVIKTRSLTPSGYSGYATLAGHPHAKPVDVMESLISACPPGIIVDPFAGSGSTLVAAKLQGRNAIGVEIEERYCEIAARRLCQGVLEFPSMSDDQSSRGQGADLAEQEIARLRDDLAEMTDDRNEYLMFWRRHRAQLEDMAEADQRLPEKEPQG